MQEKSRALKMPAPGSALDHGPRPESGPPQADPGGFPERELRFELQRIGPSRVILRHNTLIRA